MNKIKYLNVLFILYLLCFLPFVYAQDKILSREDILLAELKVQKINDLEPLERSNYPCKTIGIDSRVNRMLEEAYVCDDLCPSYGSVYLRYVGIDEQNCANLGNIKHSPGWHGYAGCMPLPVKINIYLKNGERIENVIFLETAKFILRYSNTSDDRLEWKFIFLDDVAFLETEDGVAANKFFQEFKPPVLSSYENLADEYYREGEVLMKNSGGTAINSEAFALFSKAIEINPGYLNAYYKIAEIYKKNCRAIKGEIETMISLFEQFVQQKPDDAQTFYQLGQFYRARAFERQDNGWPEAGDLNKSIEMFKKAASLKPDFLEAYYWQARDYEDLKNCKKVVETLEKWFLAAKTMEVDRFNIEQSEVLFYRCKGRIVEPLWKKARDLNESGRHDEAIAELHNVLEIFPDYQAALFTMAIAYKYKGNMPKALEYFERLIQLKPPFHDNSNHREYYEAASFKKMGELYMTHGDYSNARRCFLRSIEINKDRLNKWNKDRVAKDIAEMEGFLKRMPSN